MKHCSVFGALALASFASFATAKAKGDGYYGYRLNRRGDDESAIYETENTNSGIAPLNEEPDVYLNANVSVGEISIEVQNITAKINLDAKVLNLLNFNAGVDLGIDRVKLGIYNVTAKVELEARLGNILRMVDDVLESIDLNPIIATLGDTVKDIVDDVGDAVGGSSGGNGSGEDAEALEKRDLTARLENNILYSVNDFSGSTNRNRVLTQDGFLYDIYLNNNGVERRRKEVGFYSKDMKFTGHNKTITGDEGVEYELQYTYAPYHGLSAYCNIYTDQSGKVLRTKIVAEAEGGGAATIVNKEEEI
ncbi:hypothetical protein IWW34DRAFT_695803 [Fusarium oxysporum f. sp. albedinis]|uniref:Uncharacterized protein n=6 Tax=Fusarium oxysporum TaxID=5507 RepID=A0A420MJZ7_FUSOX|nr:hypothetical protein FOYG_14065 [Fusarium oxysporum NRRL 32931]EXK30398.1 hypothetical protein FOMG_13210 [Fusarium oxysporum f. sp. melonis 26406]KAF5267439.1 hypothetical protein FOXYS1_1688 [Fusarium oxysporum]KAI3578638.1 hypothetical protein IWW34DRAFT_695803 [Fusarium oxysporum f. sp. albedinis]PCD26128.1 hypothetical protein AU210_012560 [Fusarium oxysporum f. sp. radicis-cucumerinum]RKK11489.1 hypothetical protein BFJ65_g13370 [Fusarium oxysporum f. sp. cepae]RYC86206.1 hypothetica